MFVGNTGNIFSNGGQGTSAPCLFNLEINKYGINKNKLKDDCSKSLESFKGNWKVFDYENIFYKNTLDLGLLRKSIMHL